MTIEDRADKLRTKFSNHPNKDFRIDSRKQPKDNERFKPAFDANTQEEKLINLLTTPEKYGATVNASGWIQVPIFFYEIARELSFKGTIEWYERTKEAKLKNKNQDQIESVAEAIGAMISNEASTDKFDYVERQFERIPKNEFDGLWKLQISNDAGGKTNTFSLSEEGLLKLKEILKAEPSYRNNAG